MAVLISPYLSQKVVGLGVRVSAGSTLEPLTLDHVTDRVRLESSASLALTYSERVRDCETARLRDCELWCGAGALA